MDATTVSFYVTGGTLQRDAPSYVERQADRDLYAGLTRGEFCYVLTSRQMGKSSLMVHTAARLRAESVAVVVLDLTGIGQNLSTEPWYGGLLRRVGRQLDPSGDLEEKLDEFWFAQAARVGPLERWLAALERILLPQVPGRLVLFIDEIDAVRSLPFSTDEFFAAIRECYNRRSQDPAFERLTFCLLGVATPSDLIQDTRTTPFNIGTRIDLADFSAAEAAPLAAGLGRSEQNGAALLERVLYWTGGHPYLTQRLCQAVAETVARRETPDASGTGPRLLATGDRRLASDLVDRQCDALFLSAQARERDDNLLFVRERLLKSEADRASLLDEYAQVRAGKRVRVDDTNPLLDLLRLSGITRVDAGRLRVRNRIYERVFDRAWITQQMPDAELRRQRAAFQRGRLRAAAVSALILAALGGLAVTAVRQAHRADQQRRVAQQQRLRAEEGQETLRRHLYASQMNVAQQAWESGNLAGALVLLEAQRPQPGQQDLRGFEWRYLWRLAQSGARFTLPGNTAAVTGVAFSPDGRTLAACGLDPTIRLWKREPGDPRGLWQERGVLKGHRAGVNQIVFSPDGKMLASASWDGTAKLWDRATGRAVATLDGHAGGAWCVSFSPDGRRLATGSNDDKIRLWDVRTRRMTAVLTGHTDAITCLAFTPEGTRLVTGSRDRTLKLWNVTTGREVATPKPHQAAIACLALSPDGKRLAAATGDWYDPLPAELALWDLGTREKVAILPENVGWVSSVAFSPDGRSLAAGNADGTFRLWDLASTRPVAAFKRYSGSVSAVAFSPDGKMLATGGGAEAKLWPIASREDAAAVLERPASLAAVAFSPDGRMLATGTDEGAIELWQTGARRRIAVLRGHKAAVRQLAFSPDGKILASGGDDRTVQLWNVPVLEPQNATPTPPVRRRIARFAGATPSSCGIAFSPDGRMLAIGSEDRTVRLWDLTARRFVAAFRGNAGAVFAVAFSPYGKVLASYSISDASPNYGDPVQLWDVRSRREIGRLQGAQWLAPLLFSPDGRHLITSSTGGDLKVWDLATRRVVASLEEPLRPSVRVALSPDGQTLATNEGNTVRLWNLALGQVVAILKGHQGVVTGVAFSPDGNTLASASSDGALRLWCAAPFWETDLPQVVASGSDRTVALEWQPLPGARGYNVYRRAGVQGFRPVPLQLFATSLPPPRSSDQPSMPPEWVRVIRREAPPFRITHPAS